jgi:hypothetical protein
MKVMLTQLLISLQCRNSSIWSKTLQKKASALDRVNVRRLLIAT